VRLFGASLCASVQQGCLNAHLARRSKTHWGLGRSQPRQVKRHALTERQANNPDLSGILVAGL
jgi:hypothetical protein